MLGKILMHMMFPQQSHCRQGPATLSIPEPVFEQWVLDACSEPCVSARAGTPFQKHSPVQVPPVRSSSGLAAALPPILKAYPSQGSLQIMVSSSSGDQNGPLASSSMQDVTPRGVMMSVSSAGSALQRSGDGLDTPHAQVTL